ncbi:hypothetical protein D1P53_002846 [Cryptococcus gattii VGV]|nr:hypothetical protein D1P53_002846 [Cryptococcus gattii VGV]
MSSSSSSKPSGSSSSTSSSKPSSSSSSSSSIPKPSSPQPVPTISANAWMSFFLFCCLVLIILQGPLGLTGGGALPGVAQWAQWPNFGGEWWTGWGGLGSGLGFGGPPGCVGVVAGMVPWCQPQVHQPPPQLPLNPPLPQVQIQQIIQNPPPLPPPHYPPPRPRIVSYQPAAGAGSQMGGQGGFSTPEGGGGWSWYVNGPSPAFPGVVRHVHKNTIQPSSDQSNINVQAFSYRSRPVLNNQLTLIHKFPTNPIPTLITPNLLNTDVPSINHGFALPLLLMPNHTLPVALDRCMNAPVLMRIGINNRTLTFIPTATTNTGNTTWLIPNAMPMRAGGNIQAQVQGQGGQPIRAVHPPPQQAVPCPPQAVPVHPPIGVTPDPLGGLANLENAFYPLLSALLLRNFYEFVSQRSL